MKQKKENTKKTSAYYTLEGDPNFVMYDGGC